MKYFLSAIRFYLFLLVHLALTTYAGKLGQPGRHLQQFEEGCTVYVVVGFRFTESLICQTESGMGYEIDQVDEKFIKDNFEDGPFVSGETEIVPSSIIYLNSKANSLSIPNLVLRKKGTSTFDKRKLASTKGDKSVLVVRVIATDGETTKDENQLSDGAFGTFGDLVNLKSQYGSCSHNQLNLLPANPLVGNSTSINNGVTTITVNLSTTLGHAAMRNAITAELLLQFDVGNPTDIADHILYCMPPEAMSNIAYAFVNHWLSVYKDSWCTYVSSQLHEVGHNLNLHHSGESGEYDDQSGVMGYSYNKSDFPKMCFNGAKSWQLQWYSDKHLQIETSDPSYFPGAILYNGELASVTESLTDDSVPSMIIKLNTPSPDDYYIVFNKKAGFNSETREGGDQVLITQQGKEGTGLSKSKLLAKLSSNEVWTTSSIMVKVQSIDDRASILICHISCPTSSPSMKPSSTPISIPSFAPEMTPTSSPSLASAVPSNQNTCSDSPLTMAVLYNDKYYFSTCADAFAKYGYAICNVNDVSRHCPFTCGSCSSCTNSQFLFEVEASVWKRCGWVGKDQSSRCELNGVKESCRKTCGNC